MSHVTELQRDTIEVMLSQEYKQSEIALASDKCPSVLSREIKSNYKNGCFSRDSLYSPLKRKKD
jgi:IS30 family transposase